MRIPKAIYQTCKNKSEIPKSIQLTIDQMLKNNPEYSYHIYDDNDVINFIKKEYTDPEVLRTFNKLNVGASKADFWRYLIIYKYGGIYLDIDSVIYGKLNDYIGENDEVIITRERNDGLLVQWCMMFSQSHPILKYCIEECIKNVENESTQDILSLTGPKVYTRAVNKYIKEQIPDCAISNVYHMNDEYLNTHTNCRFQGYDYEGLCQFKHPEAHLLYQNKKHWQEEREIFRKENLTEVFDNVYKNEIWGPKGNGSGSGSEPETTEYLQKILLDIMKTQSCKSLLDTPCGACKWTKQLIEKCVKDIPGFKYCGIDVSSIAVKKARNELKEIGEDRVRIEEMNMCQDKLPEGYDIILCRDALQHLSEDNIKAAIKNFAKTESKWIILGGYPNGKNEKIKDGEYFDFNPLRYPYNLTPKEIINERHQHKDSLNKHLFLYETSYLREALKKDRL